MSAPKVWLSHSKSNQTTADLGWYITDGGRSCPPPSPNSYVIDDIPYRNGDIDVGVALGLAADYTTRELAYTFAKSSDTSSDLVAWAALCRGAELKDGCTGDVFTDVTFKSMSISTDAPNLQRVTLTFKANPFKKDGSL